MVEVACKFPMLPPDQREAAHELDRILAKGLPVTYEVVGPKLLKLVGFVGDLSSTPESIVWPYVDKLDTLVRETLEDFENDELSQAAHIYFGYAAGSRGVKFVKDRERRIAQLCHRDKRTITRWRNERIIPYMIRQMYRAAIGPSPQPKLFQEPQG